MRNREALEAFERNRRGKSELEASGSINGGHGGHCSRETGLVESMKTVPHVLGRYDLSDAEPTRGAGVLWGGESGKQGEQVGKR